MGTVPTIATSHVPIFPELHGAALIRELHTYGAAVPIAGRDANATQHRGLGRRLVAEAERIAAEEWRARRIAVIAGVGVRGYYRKLGYALDGTYMTKTIHRPRSPATGSQMAGDAGP